MPTHRKNLHNRYFDIAARSFNQLPAYTLEKLNIFRHYFVNGIKADLFAKVKARLE